MFSFFSGLADYVSSSYNTVVGTPGFLEVGRNVFVGELPDDPALAVGIFPDAAFRNPSDKTRRPEFELVVRVQRGKEGDGAQLLDKIYKNLDGKANVVTGFPCSIRALEEPFSLGKDNKSRPIFVNRFVLWGISFS